MRKNNKLGPEKVIFLAGISIVDDVFPMNLWDQLLDQVDIALNILWPIIINPPLSEYNMILVTFYFNSTPMVPPGCKIIFHEKPGNTGCGHFMEYPGFTLSPY